MTRRRAAALVATVLAGALPAVAGADQTTALVARSTQLAAAPGLVVYSAWDAALGQYRLLQLIDGVPSAVPVAPSPRPFQADVGPTASGHPYFVYVRCTAEAGSCDLYTFNPATQKELMSRASDPRHDEQHPTYWRGRLAFVREFGDERKPKQIVYQRPSSRTSRSIRLPGLPARRCAKGSCIDPEGRFDALELYGERLAQTAASVEISVSTVPGRPPEIFRSRQTELRLVDVQSGRSEQLAAVGRGEGGQSWVGVAFDAGRLYAAFTCLGDSGGCTSVRAGLYRYRYTTEEWALSPRGSTPTYALAVAQGVTYELRDGPGLECDQEFFGAPGAGRCALLRREPAPAYAATSAP